MLSKPTSRRKLAALTLVGLGSSKAIAGLHSPAPANSVASDPLNASADLAGIEVLGGGRLGVLAVDTATGSSIAYRADEPFPMCSTHKILVGAAILSGVEERRVRLDQRIPYSSADILEYAPVTKRNLTAGFMTVEALCEAAVRWSDNTADNLLLKLLGGPSAWTRYARSIGDEVSRLDRYEPQLNSSIPGDPRDTSSPRAMNRTLATIMFGNVLSDVSRAHLKRWMLDSDITKNLLRAGLPAGWHAADKSGSGSNGTRNDVGVLYPPRAAPIVLSVFYTGSAKPISERESIIAKCAKIVVRQLV
jgi:beta-lactamase class A